MLKKRFFGMMTLLVGVMLVFAIAGCSDGGGGGKTPTTRPPAAAQTVTFTGTAGSETYSLKITENTARAAYTPEAGDGYILTVGSKTSTGTVISYSSGTFELQPADEDAESFVATVSGTGLTGITGEITWDDGSTTEAPGEITPPSTPPAGGGTVTSADFIGTWENSFTQMGNAWTRRMKIDGDGTFYLIEFMTAYPNAINVIGYGKWVFEPTSKQLELAMCVPEEIISDLNSIDYNDSPSSWLVFKIENGKLIPAYGSGTEYTKQ